MQPRDINIIYNEIVEKLETSNNKEILAAFQNAAAGAVTGSEALIDQGSYLAGLKTTNPAIYKLLEQQINDYVKYCRHNGLLIR